MLTVAERQEMWERAQRIAEYSRRATAAGEAVAMLVGEALSRPRPVGDDLVQSIAGVAGVTEEQARQVSALLVAEYAIERRGR